MFYSLGTRISYITENKQGNVLLRVFIFGSLLYLILHYYLYIDRRWEAVDKMKHYLYYVMFVDFVISYLLIKWNSPSKQSTDEEEQKDIMTNEQLEEIERNYRELRELRKQISPTPAETYRNKVEQKEEEEKEEKTVSISASQKSPFMTRDEISENKKEKEKKEETESKHDKKKKDKLKKKEKTTEQDNITDTNIPLFVGK
jgi:hypothetical protein